MAWLLARHVGLVCPPWLIQQWERPGLPGRKPWPTTVLVALWVMRFRGEGIRRRAAVREAKNNAQWRAALRLKWTDQTPGKRVVARFERFLLRRDPRTGMPRYLQLFEHIGRVCMDAGVLGKRPVWAVDSTPMWCFGAVLDTIRQLGDGVRSLASDPLDPEPKSQPPTATLRHVGSPSIWRSAAPPATSTWTFVPTGRA